MAFAAQTRTPMVLATETECTRHQRKWRPFMHFWELTLIGSFIWRTLSVTEIRSDLPSSTIVRSKVDLRLKYICLKKKKKSDHGFVRRHFQRCTAFCLCFNNCCLCFVVFPLLPPPPQNVPLPCVVMSLFVYFLHFLEAPFCCMWLFRCWLLFV